MASRLRLHRRLVSAALLAALGAATTLTVEGKDFDQRPVNQRAASTRPRLQHADRLSAADKRQAAQVANTLGQMGFSVGQIAKAGNGSWNVQVTGFDAANARGPFRGSIVRASARQIQANRTQLNAGRGNAVANDFGLGPGDWGGPQGDPAGGDGRLGGSGGWGGSGDTTGGGPTGGLDGGGGLGGGESAPGNPGGDDGGFGDILGGGTGGGDDGGEGMPSGGNPWEGDGGGSAGGDGGNDGLDGSLGGGHPPGGGDGGGTSPDGGGVSPGGDDGGGSAGPTGGDEPPDEPEDGDGGGDPDDPDESTGRYSRDSATRTAADRTAMLRVTIGANGVMAINAQALNRAGLMNTKGAVANGKVVFR